MAVLEEKLDVVLREKHMLHEAIGRIYDIADRQRYFNGEYLLLEGVPSKKVLVAGWYGAGNFGDELMLRTVLRLVPEQCLGRTYVLLWDNEAYDRCTLDLRCHVIHYPNSTWDIEKLADSFDAVIWGGGAIIDDGQCDRDPRNINTGNLFVRLNEQMIAKGKRVYALGLSSNASIKDHAYAERLSRIISLSECFSLRDPYSLMSLEQAGVDCSKTLLCEDIAFYNSDLWALEPNRGSDDPARVGVVLLCSEGSYDANQRLLRALIGNDDMRQGNCSIALIPFLGEGATTDIDYYHRLMEDLGNPLSVNIEPYASSLESLAIRRCSMLISSKYHATLIADILGIPNICICDDDHPHYRNKMLHLAELAGIPQTLFPLSELSKKAVFEKAISMLFDSSAKPLLRQEFFASSEKWLKGILKDAFEVE